VLVNSLTPNIFVHRTGFSTVTSSNQHHPFSEERSTP
jgi:hypothetical protein